MCVCVWSPGGEGGVVDEAEQLLGVTDVDQALHGQLKSQGLILWRLVHWRIETQTLAFNTSRCRLHRVTHQHSPMPIQARNYTDTIHLGEGRRR